MKKFAVSDNKNHQSGNVLIYVIIAIMLIGMLTAALRGAGDMGQDVDRESANITASQIIKYGDEVASAVNILLQNGVSESDIRFAVPGDTANTSGYGVITTNPQNQAFSRQGGAAAYRPAPAKSQSQGGVTSWGFGGNVAFFQAGSAKADLYAGLFFLNADVCEAINKQLGISPMPVVSNCSSDVFTGTYATSPTSYTYSVTPASPMLRFCTQCTNANNYTYYSVLLSR